jgi:pantoate--beta-alanine ligase
METVHAIIEAHYQVRAWRQQGLTVGFVPTMGNLHAGHLSLVNLAKQQADKVVASVFVNPLQFGPNEDFDRYPRTLEQDEQLLVQQGCDLLFAPSVEEMYPNGEIQTKVCAAPALADTLEGEKRPGHFDGVTTVVAKLFNIIQPDLAVFGQKDFQQYRVIEQMVEDLSYPIQLVRAPIARETDGLAMSSRNQYLTPEQRAVAPQLFKTLQALCEALKTSLDKPEQLEQKLHQAKTNLLEAGFDAVDYLELRDALTLAPATAQTRVGVLLAVARLGNTRLLDNCLLQ